MGSCPDAGQSHVVIIFALGPEAALDAVGIRAEAEMWLVIRTTAPLISTGPHAPANRSPFAQAIEITLLLGVSRANQGG